MYEVLIKLADANFLIVNQTSDFFSCFASFDTTYKFKVFMYYLKDCESFGIEHLSVYDKKKLLKDNFGNITLADNTWSTIDVYNSQNSDCDNQALLAALYSSLSFEHVLLCHASLIDYQGHGILFVGPSGIGKTTQAELWNKYRNADIINGDKAFIKVEKNEVRGYGLPWKGSSPYCMNADVKLDGVVVLRQAKENKIRELSFEEKLQLFVPHIFLPVWDENCMSSAMNTLDMLVPQIPVYLLECRPDEEAVELTEKTVLR